MAAEPFISKRTAPNEPRHDEPSSIFRGTADCVDASGHRPPRRGPKSRRPISPQPRSSASRQPTGERLPMQQAVANPVPDSPAVAAILETNPTTPAELVRAAKILADLQRPDLGKQLLARVIAAKLNPQQLADLAERFGSPTFLRHGCPARDAARGETTGRRGDGGDQPAAAGPQADGATDPAASATLRPRCAARRWPA